MDALDFDFEEALMTTIAELAPGKAAHCPVDGAGALDDYLFGMRSHDGAAPMLAPSALADFDAFAGVASRPVMTSTPSSASSVPSLASASSAGSVASSSSSLSSLGPLPTPPPGAAPAASASSAMRSHASAYADLSPTYGCTSPLDPGLFAAMQDAFLGERAGRSLPVSPVGASYFGLPSPPSSTPTAPRRSHAVRRASTLSPRSRPAGQGHRAPRPPPLDLAALGAMPPPPSAKRARVGPASVCAVAPPPRAVAGPAPDLDELDRVMWEIDSLVGVPASAPVDGRFAVPHYNVAGVALDLGDLDVLAGAADWTSLGLIPAAPPRAAPPLQRPRSAPIVPQLGGRRSASAPKPARRKTSFVNFTSDDAHKLLNGVAPSGSSKRKRLEQEAAAAAAIKRRSVSA